MDVAVSESNLRAASSLMENNTSAEMSPVARGQVGGGAKI